MTGIFVTILNRGIAASVVIIAVFLLRLLLKRTPGYFSYFLWIVVFARLLYPFSLEADWGIIPGMELSGAWERAEAVSVLDEKGGELRRGEEKDVGKEGTAGVAASGLSLQQNPEGQSGIAAMERNRPGIQAMENAGQVRKLLDGESGRSSWEVLSGRGFLWKIAAGIWFTVCVSLLFYSVFSYLRFMKNLKGYGGFEGRGSNVEKQRVIILENIRGPFVAGFFKPIIYLPQGLDKVQLDMVRQHEKIHIARRDYLIKPAAYLAVCIYWFNPLVWLAFHYMEKDMEISCDEAVLRKIGYENNKTYARALLYLSQEHGWRPGCPIAFGENSVKDRIKNVVKHKRTKIWMIAAGGAMVLAAAVLLFVNSRWKLVISLEEKQTADVETEDSMEEVQGVPGTDSNTEITHIYIPENPDSKDKVLTEEKIYLPSEKIVHSEPIKEGDVSSGSEKMAHSEPIPEGEDNAETSHYFYASETEKQKDQSGSKDEGYDSYAVLLRQAEGIYEENMLKYAYPLEYDRISDDYGIRIHPVTQIKKIHSGIDFAAAEGTAVKATADGTVLETGFDAECGNYVIIQHDNGDMTYYANCSEILSQEGQSVEMGEQIATVGSTGRSTGAHLHYALSRNGEYIRPEFAENENS